MREIIPGVLKHPKHRLVTVLRCSNNVYGWLHSDLNRMLQHAAVYHRVPKSVLLFSEQLLSKLNRFLTLPAEYMRRTVYAIVGASVCLSVASFDSRCSVTPPSVCCTAYSTEFFRVHNFSGSSPPLPLGVGPLESS